MAIANTNVVPKYLLREIVMKYMKDHQIKSSAQLAESVGVPVLTVDYHLESTRVLPTEENTWKLFRAIHRMTPGIESCIKDELSSRPINRVMGPMSSRSRQHV